MKELPWRRSERHKNLNRNKELRKKLCFSSKASSNCWRRRKRIFKRQFLHPHTMSFILPHSRKSALTERYKNCCGSEIAANVRQRQIILRIYNKLYLGNFYSQFKNASNAPKNFKFLVVHEIFQCDL